MKRTLSFGTRRETVLIYAGTGLIACTYGLVRLAYGLFLPDVQRALAMGATTAGYISSAASLAYCVGAVFGLVAADHSRALVVGALLTASAGSVGMAMAPDLAWFAPAAIVASAGAGLASPALVVIVERNIRTPDRDRAQATVNAGTGPGLVLAGLLALTLLPQWRVGFAISALLTAVIGIGVLLLDQPRMHDDASPRASRVSRRPPHSFRVLLRPATAAALLGAASAVVWTYGRAQVVAEGGSGAVSILAWIGVGVGGTATVLTARLLSGWHPERAWLLTSVGVAAAIATLGLAADDVVAAMAACVLFGWAFVAATSALIGWTASLLPEHAASGTSLLFITLVLGQAAGSAAAGSVIERHSMSTAFLVAAAVAVVAASCGRRHAVP